MTTTKMLTNKHASLIVQLDSEHSLAFTTYMVKYHGTTILSDLEVTLETDKSGDTSPNYYHITDCNLGYATKDDRYLTTNTMIAIIEAFIHYKLDIDEADAIKANIDQFLDDCEYIITGNQSKEI